MKIVMTGASGFVGSQLVPLFTARGAELLLTGRDPGALAQRFPGIATCGYADLASRAKGFDLLIHAAVANSDSTLPEAEIWAANVDLVASVMQAAAAAGVGHVVHLSSFHALDGENGSAYARSKRASLDVVANAPVVAKTVISMPLVYGTQWAGKLSALNRLPLALARALFRPLAALKPTLAVSTLADRLWRIGKGEPTPPTLVLADDMDANGWYRFGKMLIDVGFALAVILLLGWALLLVWLAVKLQSPGPGIFAQQRVGRHGKVFTCYKFRTMAVGTRNAGTHEVSASTITRLGGFLRRTKIDELPQVVNILRNEMSLVGPRPCLPSQADVVAARQAENVLRLLPGITGLAQIRNVDMSTPHALALADAEYGVTRSLLLDVKIILATLLGKGQGDKVRRP